MKITNIIFMILSTFFFTVFFIPIVIKIATHIGALDMPNERKIQKKPIPRLGGLGIYFGFLLGYILFGKESLQMNSILIGSFIIIITGVIDDISPIPAKYKFLGQLAGAAVVPLYGEIVLQDISAFGIYINFGMLSVPVTILFIVSVINCINLIDGLDGLAGAAVVPLYGGIVLQDISAFGIYINFGMLSIPITILFIVSVINCINLIDGLDGLAGGLSSIYFLTIGIIALVINNANGLDILLTFIMLGSTLGFLWHNFNPAKIFMGDSGSMFLGYIISVIALIGFKNVTLTSFIVPLFLLAIPILDTLFAIIRRLINHKPISAPDKNHLHHQFLNMKFSQKKTVLIIYGVDALFALASIIYVIGDSKQGILMYTLLLIMVLVFIFKTNIIWNHDKKEKK